MDTAASPPPQLRADYRKLAALYQDRRTPDRLLAHYLVERRLADSFRASTRQERENGAYNQLYDTLLREVHDHPRRAATHVPTDDYTKRQVRMLLRGNHTPSAALSPDPRRPADGYVAGAEAR